tara:strand:+ start:1127 stop:1501 length:375 start_codon:yes stop_codon:yes gene_type:complete
LDGFLEILPERFKDWVLEDRYVAIHTYKELPGNWKMCMDQTEAEVYHRLENNTDVFTEGKLPENGERPASAEVSKMNASFKQDQTLGNYQEAGIRNLHNTPDDLIKKRIRRVIQVMGRTGNWHQ